MKPTIRLAYCDFWPDFRPQTHFTWPALSARYHVVLDDAEPDFVIYSDFGHEHLRHDAVRVYVTNENLRPDFNLCDYAIGFDRMAFGDRNFRFPYFANFFDQLTSLQRRPPLTLEDLRARTGFCNFIYSNPNAAPERDRLFDLLNDIARVDSPGRHRNTMGDAINDRYASGWHAAKIPFMSGYRFSIACENASTPGYVTEKILDAFSARTIPVYWGAPDVALDFNPSAFVNCHDYPSLEAAAQAVRALADDEEAMLDMLNASPFAGGRTPAGLTRQALADFLHAVFDQTARAARRRSPHVATARYERERRMAAKGLALFTAAHGARFKVRKRLSALKRPRRA